VDRFPTDESPYGIRGMAGNTSDPCLNDLAGIQNGWRFFGGGSWGSAMSGVRSAYRLAATVTAVYPPRSGIRPYAPVKVPVVPSG